jgi:hypothetical protein
MSSSTFALSVPMVEVYLTLAATRTIFCYFVCRTVKSLLLDTLKSCVSDIGHLDLSSQVHASNRVLHRVLHGFFSSSFVNRNTAGAGGRTKVPATPLGIG